MGEAKIWRKDEPRPCYQRREFFYEFPYHEGDKIKIDVPREVDRKVKDFTIEKIYPDYVLLNDGIIRVCFPLMDCLPVGKVLKGEWT